MFKKTALVMLVLLFALSACSINGFNVNIPTRRIQGSGDIVTESREVSDFSKVDLKGIGNLTILQGTTESFELTADDNLMKYITVEVVGDTLEIGTEDNVILDPSKTIQYTLTVKELDSVALSGFGNISAETFAAEDLTIRLAGSGDLRLGDVTGSTLDLRISGFGDVTADSINVEKPVLEITGSGDITVDELKATDLEVKISGFGNAELTGKTETQNVQILGSGEYNAEDLESTSATVKVTGFGDSQLWVKEKLNVTITGSGDVEYYGDASVTQTITGFGKVSPQGNH